MVTEMILSSRLREAFQIVHVDTSDHRPISNVGRVDVRNVALGLGAATAFAAALMRRDVDMVYLPIAKNRVGFLRDALFLLAARAARRPTVVHFHARGFQEFRREEPWWMRHLIRLSLATGRVHGIVLGEGLRAEFGDLLPACRVHVLANGVADHRAPDDPGARSQPTVLHLSTLWSTKGVFEVLESAARLRIRFPDLRYVLAGGWYSPTEARAAERFIADHDLQDVVQVLGPVGGDQKNRLLAGATLMAFPSHTEGHPLVVLEALSASLPVIATRVGAIPEIIEDGQEGFVIDARDVDALTERIAHIIADPALRARMSRAARARYERDFTAERFTNGLGAIWSSINGVPRPVIDHTPESEVGAVVT